MRLSIYPSLLIICPSSRIHHVASRCSAVQPLARLLCGRRTQPCLPQHFEHLHGTHGQSMLRAPATVWARVTRLTGLQVAARTSKAGTTAFMKGRSFGVFGIQNRWRRLVFQIMFSQVSCLPASACHTLTQHGALLYEPYSASRTVLGSSVQVAMAHHTEPVQSCGAQC